MADVKNEVVGAAGVGMATGPGIASKLVDTPFYESSIWLSVMAIMGAALIAVSLCNAIIRFRRSMSKEGKK